MNTRSKVRPPKPRRRPWRWSPGKACPGPKSQRILQAHPDGLQIAENKVAFDNGKVVLTLPDENGESTAAGDQSPGPTLLSFSSSVHGCPNGWYCFYENDKFRGRRLQFRDCSSGGTTQSLANYGFDNQTTSWLVNRSVGSIEVYHVTVAKNGSGVTELWREEAYSSSSNVVQPTTTRPTRLPAGCSRLRRARQSPQSERPATVGKEPSRSIVRRARRRAPRGHTQA